MSRKKQEPVLEDVKVVAEEVKEPVVEEVKEPVLEIVDTNAKYNRPEYLVILPTGEKRLYRYCSHGEQYKMLAKNLAQNPKYKGAKIIEK